MVQLHEDHRLAKRKSSAILKLREVVFIFFQQTTFHSGVMKNSCSSLASMISFLFQLWFWNNYSFVFWLEIACILPAMLYLLLLNNSIPLLYYEDFFFHQRFCLDSSIDCLSKHLDNCFPSGLDLLNKEEVLVNCSVCLSCLYWEGEQEISPHPSQPSQMELSTGYITSPCNLPFSNNFNLDGVHIFHELLANFESNSFTVPSRHKGCYTITEAITEDTRYLTTGIS